MKLSLVVPVRNQLQVSKCAWATTVGSMIDREELVVIDNGSTDGTGEFLLQFVSPRFDAAQIVTNSGNAGIFKSMNQGWRAASGDVVGFLHNDLFVYDHGWDRKVRTAFELHPKAGLIGFCGARGADANGGRHHVYSNLLEAELHGFRSDGFFEVALLDSLAMFARRAMLEQIGGIDEAYAPFHYHDKELCMDSREAGWQTYFMGVACHHYGGLTCDREAGFTHGEFMADNHARYLSKWRHRLPFYV